MREKVPKIKHYYTKEELENVLNAHFKLLKDYIMDKYETEPVHNYQAVELVNPKTGLLEQLIFRLHRLDNVQDNPKYRK